MTKYKICSYKNGFGEVFYRIKYRYEWIPFWFTYENFYGVVEESSLALIEDRKRTLDRRALCNQRTLMNCGCS